VKKAIVIATLVWTGFSVLYNIGTYQMSGFLLITLAYAGLVISTCIFYLKGSKI